MFYARTGEDLVWFVEIGADRRSAEYEYVPSGGSSCGFLWAETGSREAELAEADLCVWCYVFVFCALEDSGGLYSCRDFLCYRGVRLPVVCAV